MDIRIPLIAICLVVFVAGLASVTASQGPEVAVTIGAIGLTGGWLLGR